MTTILFVPLLKLIIAVSGERPGAAYGGIHIHDDKLNQIHSEVSAELRVCIFRFSTCYSCQVIHDDELNQIHSEVSA